MMSTLSFYDKDIKSQLNIDPRTLLNRICLWILDPTNKRSIRHFIQKTNFPEKSSKETDNIRTPLQPICCERLSLAVSLTDATQVICAV